MQSMTVFIRRLRPNNIATITEIGTHVRQSSKLGGYATAARTGQTRDANTFLVCNTPVRLCEAQHTNMTARQICAVSTAAGWRRMKHDAATLAASRSRSTAASYEQSIELENSTSSSTQSRPQYEVHVTENGKTLSIRFPPFSASKTTKSQPEEEGEENEKASCWSTFHASWLWFNDPTHVLPTSGQRTRSPGEYRGWAITSAEIIPASLALATVAEENQTVTDAQRKSQIGNKNILLPIPPPPKGCCHPIGAVYKTKRHRHHHYRKQHDEQLSSQQQQQQQHQCYEIVDNVEATAAAESRNKKQMLLRVTWNDSSHDDDHDHYNPLKSASGPSPSVSYYDIDWLQQWRYDDYALEQRRQRTEVTTRHALRCSNKDDSGQRMGAHGLVCIEYDDIASYEKNTDSLFHLLHAIFQNGAAIVRNAPLITSGPFTPVSVVGHALAGYLSHGSLYGDVFHVRSIPDAHNIAYTSIPLRPHQDMAYYESMPGIQLLHCIAMGDNVVGGESTLIDCLAAAEEFRRMAPQHFRILVSCPATFVKQRDKACMTYQRPHIVLMEEGKPAMNKNDNYEDDMDREIVQVNWSPPFEGPLCIPAEWVDAYFAAYRAFELMLDNSVETVDDPSVEQFSNYAREYTWEYRLKPGEMLIFNNRRMLHGRRGFSVKVDDTSLLPGGVDNNMDPSISSGLESRSRHYERHLVGAYTNIDDTLNRYRVLLRDGVDVDDNMSVLSVGNGTTIVP